MTLYLYLGACSCLAYLDCFISIRVPCCPFHSIIFNSLRQLFTTDASNPRTLFLRMKVCLKSSCNSKLLCSSSFGNTFSNFRQRLVVRLLVSFALLRRLPSVLLKCTSWKQGSHLSIRNARTSVRDAELVSAPVNGVFQ